MRLRMKGVGILVILGTTIVTLAGSTRAARAASPADSTVVCLHAQAHNTKGLTCDGSPEQAGIACDQYTKTWPLQTGADVYMILAKGDSLTGIAALTVGIEYSQPVSRQDGIGCDVFDYVLCAELEYPNSPDNVVAHEWPWSGGGNVLVWSYTNHCQRKVLGNYGVHTTACAFYVYAYSADTFAVTKNNNLQGGPDILISDCSLAIHHLVWPQAGGKIGFGTNTGFNPCTDTVPVKGTTWGRLKQQYH